MREPAPEIRHTPYRKDGLLEYMAYGTDVTSLSYSISLDGFDPAGAGRRVRSSREKGGGGTPPLLRALFERRITITGLRSRVHRRGYGRELVLALEGVAVERMAGRIVSEQSNIFSARLFSRIGYRITPRNEGGYRAEFSLN